MTTAEEATGERVRPGRQRVALALAAFIALPGVVLRLTDAHLSDPVLAGLFGLAIVGAAFLLSWGAEVAQLDISAGLAIAVLAFIAVLPEYAVDLVFAVKGGGGNESPCSLALANMTGANRLLIGVGWSVVGFIAWRRWKAKGDAERGRAILLERTHSVELSYLTVATLYPLTLPLERSVTLIDAAVLVTIFVLYTLRISRAPAEEPHLVGPARWIGTFETGRRRASVVGLFVFAAAVILLVAEHFAVAILVDLAMSIREAPTLLGLFLVQFVVGAVGPEAVHDEVRIITAIVYLVLAVGLLARSRRQAGALLSDGFRTPYATMTQG